MLIFLWRSGPEDKVGVYEYTRHFFAAKSSPARVNHALLQAGIDNKEGHQKAIKREFYLDHFAKSVATVEEANQVDKDVRTTLKSGEFNLLKWICNNDLVTGSIPEGDKSKAENKTFELSFTRHHFRA